MRRTVVVELRKASSREPLHLLVARYDLRMLDDPVVKVTGAALAETRQEKVREATHPLLLVVITRVFAPLYKVERALQNRDCKPVYLTF